MIVERNKYGDINSWHINKELYQAVAETTKPDIFKNKARGTIKGILYGEYFHTHKYFMNLMKDIPVINRDHYGK